jgi:hypothetical protein
MVLVAGRRPGRGSASPLVLVPAITREPDSGLPAFGGLPPASSCGLPPAYSVLRTDKHMEGVVRGELSVRIPCPISRARAPRAILVISVYA